jgi:hypothetical protein
VKEEITKEDIHHGVEEVAKIKITPSKKVRFNPKVFMQDTPHGPRTRSAIKSLAYIEEARFEPHVGHRDASMVEVHSSPKEIYLRVKRLRNQLREARDLIVNLREENKEMKVKITANMDHCEKAIDNNINMVKRSLHIHKKLKNVYKHKMVLQKENRVMKRKLHKLKKRMPKGIWTCSHKLLLTSIILSQISILKF